MFLKGWDYTTNPDTVVPAGREILATAKRLLGRAGDGLACEVADMYYTHDFMPVN